MLTIEELLLKKNKTALIINLYDRFVELQEVLIPKASDEPVHGDFWHFQFEERMIKSMLADLRLYYGSNHVDSIIAKHELKRKYRK